MINSSNSSSLL